MIDADRLSQLVSAVRRREARHLARAITAVENQMAGWTELIDALYPFAGAAWRIGVTGPPGAGKSTLTDRLIAAFREADQTVAVVAVDPTSPFTGGALLGDRIRMPSWHDDPGVFIRSVATRGALGGLSLAADSAADILDAAGFDVVLLETVGVGQAEIDVARACDSVVVVLSPDAGDSIQAMKAGLIEIADVFCINKADFPEATRFARTLRSALEMRSAEHEVDVLETVATRSQGIATAIESLRAHRVRLETTGRWPQLRLDRLRFKVSRIIEARYLERFWTPHRLGVVQNAISNVEGSERRPFLLARRLLGEEQAE